MCSPCDSGVSIWEPWFLCLLLCFSSSQMACRPGFLPIWPEHRGKLQHSVSANNAIILYCLNEEDNKRLFSLFMESRADESKPGLEHKIQPIHTVVLFNSAVFIHCYRADGKVWVRAQALPALEWPLLSFLHSKTDAGCGLRSCVQQDLNHKDWLQTHSLHASAVFNAETKHSAELAVLR